MLFLFIHIYFIFRWCRNIQTHHWFTSLDAQKRLKVALEILNSQMQSSEILFLFVWVWNPHWPSIPYVTKDVTELLTLLTPILSDRITGICHHIHQCRAVDQTQFFNWYSSASPENICTRNSIQTEQVRVWNIYAYTYMHVHK